MKGTPALKVTRGAPTFTIASGSIVNSGAIAKEQLEPIDAYVLQHASACIVQ